MEEMSAACKFQSVFCHDTGTSIALDMLLPAPSQGAVGIECHSDNQTVRDLLAGINDSATFACVSAERLWLKTLGADCHSSVAALAVFDGPDIVLRAQMLMPDGSESIEDHVRFDGADLTPAAELATAMLAKASPALRALFHP